MNHQNKKRILSPYEKNQLAKYGIDQEKLLSTQAPVEYVTKHVDFCDSVFYVDKNVLIPRIETEELVELAVKKTKTLWKHRLEEESSNNDLTQTLTIADVGTGSGAIAISVARKLEALGIYYEIIGLDISDEALSVANKNLSRINENFGKNLKVKFVKSNLLTNFDSTKKLDLIIANLPYIPSDRINNLDSSVKDFEPHLALDGGKDGLDLVRKLLKQSKPILKKNGIVLLELDITHTQEKMKEFAGEWNTKIVESEFGGVRFGILKKLATK